MLQDCKPAFACILLISLFLSANATRNRKSTWHSIQKRSCSIRGETCWKDVTCCTAECVCTSNQCKCGNRPKVKLLKLKPESFFEAQRLERLPEAQRLECHY